MDSQRTYVRDNETKRNKRSSQKKENNPVEVFYLKEVPANWGVQTSSCRFPDSTTNTAISLQSSEKDDDEECFPAFKSSYSRKGRSSSNNTLKGKLLNWMSMCFWNCSAGCQKIPTMD